MDKTKAIDNRTITRWHYRAFCNKCGSDDCQVVQVIDEHGREIKCQELEILEKD